MTHCIRTRLPEICYAPIGQNGVNYNANGYIIFLDHRLKELAPNSYEFLYLHGKKIIDITQKGFSTENENQIQKNIIKQVAADLAVFAVNCYSMNYLPASLTSLPIWFLACKLTNCANERIKAKEVDASLVKDPLIPPEVLKGGLLFYKAWQEVNKTKNRIFFTNYGESRFSVLESTPPLEERITQIEEELKRRGINIEVDQKTTEKIEKLFYSSI